MSLDDFKVLKGIGQGAFGEVFLVKNYFSSEVFALKSIDKSFLSKQRKEHHIFQEKLILQYLNHPMVVKLTSTFQDEQKLYFLMENIPNGELSHYIKVKGKLRRKIELRRM
jgi:serine/threonine protein kinase